ncbi:MAG TPA: (2Fe-2S)-binding protein [Pseudonocardia sp.]|jgi:bacterioferritin-associated ferredoxin|nr:(2Fe-2S)-binding protein [Pseudonocardia sp.]
MFVCMCRAVTERQILACIRAGASSVEAVSEQTRAGTGCGGCLDTVEMILEDGGVTGELITRSCPLARSA